MKALPSILQGPSSLAMPLAGGADDQVKKDKDKDKRLAAISGGAAAPLINARRGGGLLQQFMGAGS